VVETAKVLAATRDMTFERIAELTTANFLTLFDKAAAAVQRLQRAG
jgi:TatD DNase family protein